MSASQQRALSINNEIEQYKKIYADAIGTNSNRADLQQHLQNLLKGDFVEFEKQLEKIIEKSRPDKIGKITLGYFWEPGRIFGGSRLRKELIKAHSRVEELKGKFLNLKLSEILGRLDNVVKKLNDVNALKKSEDIWNELRVLQKDAWDLNDLLNIPHIHKMTGLENKLNQLKDFILYKQAELFFNKFIGESVTSEYKGADLKDLTAKKNEAEHGINRALHILIQGESNLMDDDDAMAKIKEKNQELLAQSEELFIHSRVEGQAKASSPWKQIESLYAGKKLDSESIQIVVFLRDLYLQYQKNLLQKMEDPDNMFSGREFIEEKSDKDAKKGFSEKLSKSLDSYQKGFATIQKVQNYDLQFFVKELQPKDLQVVRSKGAGR